MTTTIFAEQLQNGDIIVIPATAQTKEKKITVTGTPIVNELTVNGFAINRTGHTTPFQFGRKVDLAIERNGSIDKEAITLLKEEVEYLAHWMKTEADSLIKSQMQERKEFIELTLIKFQ